jgi:hypothetical protein
MSWEKEKREHPWASTATAKRIAKDHQHTKQHKYAIHGPKAVQAASKDFNGLFHGAERIAYQRKP